MRLVRFRHGNRIATGAANGEFVRPLQGTFFENPVPTGAEVPLSAVRMLAPIIPSKVVAVGRNYAEHAQEIGGDVPEEPVIFLKPSTAVIGPGDPIPYPRMTSRVDHEAELEVRGVEPPVGSSSWREYWAKLIAHFSGEDPIGSQRDVAAYVVHQRRARGLPPL